VSHTDGVPLSSAILVLLYCHRCTPTQMHVDIGLPRDLFLSAKNGIGEGPGCVRRKQHRFCGKKSAFPAVMHMLSTEINIRK
jgi:hypothetical protein